MWFSKGLSLDVKLLPNVPHFDDIHCGVRLHPWNPWGRGNSQKGGCSLLMSLFGEFNCIKFFSKIRLGETREGGGRAANSKQLHRGHGYNRMFVFLPHSLPPSHKQHHHRLEGAVLEKNKESLHQRQRKDEQLEQHTAPGELQCHLGAGRNFSTTK